MASYLRQRRSGWVIKRRRFLRHVEYRECLGGISSSQSWFG